MRYESGGQSGSGVMKLFQNLLLMTTGGVVMVALLLILNVWRTGERFFGGVQALFQTPQPAPQVDVRSLLIHQIRGASELTTAVFAMEAIAPTKRDRQVGQFVVGTTTLLYIAYGEVRAGVDLSQLRAEDVIASDDTLQIRLPPPQILDSKIDVNRSQVYDYDRGFLGLGPDVAPELQTLAEQTTLQKIVQAACTQGLLEEANSRAKQVVTQLVGTTTYKTVIVENQPPLPEACPAS